LVLVGKKIWPVKTQSGTHVPQTVETPIVKRGGRGAEQALNFPASEVTELVCGDSSFRTKLGDPLS
jgi:hypothetical protein